uniref:Prolyl 4-hydroxylase alpha subunit domain-containing protein n=1 Tax=Lotus japonicus TaxID=34305 RepID=I3SZ73_LOTJA|nr:unknown [Lotus japonicus]
MAKPRYSRLPSRKSSSSSTLIFALFLAFTFLLLILFALGILSIPSSSSRDKFPKPNDLTSIAHNTLDRTDDDDGRGEQWVEVISWEPRAFVYHNFLTKEECEYLIDIAKPNMHKSTVVDSETGKSKDSRVRTSSGTFLPRGRGKIVRNIEKKNC